MPTGLARTMAAAAALALAVVTSGCAPGTPDGDSWRIDAQRAVSDGASSLHTAELALRLRTKDRIYDPYLQTVLVDAEEGVGLATDSISTEQPPRAERKRYDAVTGQLDEASSLVATARIAVVDGEKQRYDALADRLADAASALQALEKELEHPPVGPARAEDGT